MRNAKHVDLIRYSINLVGVQLAVGVVAGLLAIGTLALVDLDARLVICLKVQALVKPFLRTAPTSYLFARMNEPIAVLRLDGWL